MNANASSKSGGIDTSRSTASFSSHLTNDRVLVFLRKFSALQEIRMLLGENSED